MAEDKGKARKSLSRQKKIKESYTSPINDFKDGGFDLSGNAQELIGKASQFYGKQLRNHPQVRSAENSAKLAAQFTSGAVKKTIDDVQGIAKTILKGFGN